MAIYDLQASDKNHDEFSGEEPSLQAKLEIFDRAKNHNKFWHVAVYGVHVVRHWGRHGTKGQWSVHRVYGEWAAKAAAEDLIREKRRKGYKPEVGVLDRFTRETM